MKNNLSNRVSTIVADRISYFQTLDAEANFLRSKTAPTFSRGQDPSPSFDGQPCFRGIADMDRFSTPNDLSRMPSRPGEFHPEPLTDPDLNLSIHPARVTARRLPPSAEPSGSSRFYPVGPSSTAMTCPLRSTGITPLHHYYEAVRPSPAHRYFQPRGWSRLCFFPWHRRPGSPVPYKSLIELRAAYMPDAAWAVSVHPPSLSRKMGQPPVLTSSKPISTLYRRFTYVRLSPSCLPKSCSGFSVTVASVTFAARGLRGLEIDT